MKIRILYLLAAGIVGAMLLCSACGKNPPAEPKAPAQPVNPPLTAPASKTVKPEVSKAPKFEDEEEGTLKVVIPNTEIRRQQIEEEVHVVTQKEHIKVIQRVDDAPETTRKEEKRMIKKVPVPANSLLAKLPVDESIRLEWGPLWVRQHGGMIRVPDVVISPDSTVIAFLETVGATEGPFASRIVLFDLCNWKVFKIIEIKERYGKRMVFLPNSLNLALLCERQDVLKQPYGLAVYDLFTEKELAFHPLKQAPGEHLIVDRKGRVYFTEGTTLRNLDNPAKKATKQRQTTLPESNPPLAILQDDTRLAVALPQQIMILKTGDLRPISTEDLPEQFTPKGMLFIDKQEMVLTSTDRIIDSAPALYVRNGVMRKFQEDSNGVFALDPQGHVLYSAGRVRRVIDVIRLPSLEEVVTIRPDEYRPGTSGNVRNLFFVPTNAVFCVFDDNGNFYSFHKPEKEKRYLKTLLLQKIKAE